MTGLFGGLFDLNNDGNMDLAEKALEMGIVLGALDESEKEDLASELGVEVDELEDMIERAEELGVDIEDLEDLDDFDEEQDEEDYEDDNDDNDDDDF